MNNVICEFDMAVPAHRKKTRIVLDNDGYWRLQSLVPRLDSKNRKRHVWQDEYRMDSEWPAKVPIVVQNLSSVMMAIYEAGSGAFNPEKAAQDVSKMHVISTDWHTAAYSSDSFESKTVFFETLSVVLSVSIYENGLSTMNAVGGSPENQALAKQIFADKAKLKIKDE